MLPWFFWFFAQVGLQQNPLPTFDQFTVIDFFTGSPAKPILSTRAHRRFQSMIRSGAAKGPNFAGHYTIAIWGCGASCISGVVVDAKSGAVRNLPFAVLTNGLSTFADGKTAADSDFEPLSFNLKSRLLVAHGCPEEETCGLYYYEWLASRFRLLRKIPASSN